MGKNGPGTDVFMIFRGRRSYRCHPGEWTRSTASLPLEAEFGGADSRKNGRDALLRVRWPDDTQEGALYRSNHVGNQSHAGAEAMNVPWTKVRLGEVLRRSKESVPLQPAGFRQSPISR